MMNQGLVSTLAPIVANKLNRRNLLQTALALATAGAAAPTMGRAAPAARQENAVAVGVYLPDVLYETANFDRFTESVGRQPAYLVWYEQWANGPFGPEQQAQLQQFDQWGVTPVIAWEPFDPNADPINQPDYRLANIFAGYFDAYIDSWAEGLATYGKPVFLSFAHEMNGNWTPWGVGVNGNQPGEYVAAWRHIVDRFYLLGATNVQWVWVPNEEYEDVPALVLDVYPGDDYVDWFGMNGFNWGAAIKWTSCDCQSAWRTFDEIFASTYDSLLAIDQKPIMIMETASSEVGGDKAAWITDAFLARLPLEYPAVRAVTWFNKVATGLETVQDGVVVATAEVDWPVTSSPAALAAFRRAVNEPYYQGRLDGTLDTQQHGSDAV